MTLTSAGTRPADRLMEFAASIAWTAGVPDDDAATVGAPMVDADPREAKGMACCG